VLLTVVSPTGASAARCKHIVYGLKEGVGQQLSVLHHSPSPDDQLCFLCPSRHILKSSQRQDYSLLACCLRCISAAGFPSPSCLAK